MGGGCVLEFEQLVIGYTTEETDVPPLATQLLSAVPQGGEGVPEPLFPM